MLAATQEAERRCDLVTGASVRHRKTQPYNGRSGTVDQVVLQPQKRSLSLRPQALAVEHADQLFEGPAGDLVGVKEEQPAIGKDDGALGGICHGRDRAGREDGCDGDGRELLRTKVYGVHPHE